ncbi:MULTISPECIES: hypothetical protein [Paenibacillus]|uniref:Uncharacterized protein n=3 Tax=Paenibacillus TaxID=44249 RepID=A0A0U2ILS1_9BACL|nr:MULTISPECIES: hypothetical protein [Paenibacillus]ALS21323.1 hypothetical protein IJ22_09410 [Paenibacillus naphthalenovorans]SDH96873.1 hypothetical protein SAMN05421868_10275 [Paenibacillus naphthalenovorans]
MDDKKKEMIVREIEHWRRSKLLPEHYCDFLLNIYDMHQQDQDKKEQGGLFGVTPSKIRNSNWKIWMLGLLLIIALSFTALNFNAFELPMQIGISIIFLAGCYGWGSSKLEKEPMAAQLWIGMASLFLLFIGVYLLRLHGVQASVPVVAYVALCSVVWILTGLLARLALFQLCGWVSLVFCYGWLLHYQLETLSWITLQLSWMPLAILFCWMSWIIHEKNSQAGLVFFLLSLIVWYMPELYAMLYAEKYGSQTVQWLLLSKLLAQAGLLFAWRKKWTEWVV